jgi:hypothetical protein
MRKLLVATVPVPLGASHFHPRSLVFNDEVDAIAIVLGSDIGAAFERMLHQDLSQARHIDRQEWRRWPLDQRLLELFELISFLWRNEL